MATALSIIHSHWQHSFPRMEFSPKEFYNLVEDTIKTLELPKTKASRPLISMGVSMYSPKREYLRISHGELVFDICAATFGKAFFVSFWYGEIESGLKLFFSKIPYIGPFVVKRLSTKTYFQLDTEQMFKETVQAAIMEAIDQLTAKNGVRALMDKDRIPVELMA